MNYHHEECLSSARCLKNVILICVAEESLDSSVGLMVNNLRTATRSASPSYPQKLSLLSLATVNKLTVRTHSPKPSTPHIDIGAMPFFIPRVAVTTNQYCCIWPSRDSPVYAAAQFAGSVMMMITAQIGIRMAGTSVSARSYCDSLRW